MDRCVHCLFTLTQLLKAIQFTGYVRMQAESQLAPSASILSEAAAVAAGSNVAVAATKGKGKAVQHQPMRQEAREHAAISLQDLLPVQMP